MLKLLRLDQVVYLARFPLLNDVTEFFITLRRFSQSKFHFDFRRRLRDWDRVAFAPCPVIR